MDLTSQDHLPSRSFAINTAWLAVVMLAVDLIGWTQHLLLHGDLAKAEPKTLAIAAVLRHDPMEAEAIDELHKIAAAVLAN